MRLLFLHTHIQQHCGISATIRTQAAELRERGHAVTIAALDTPMARTYLENVAPFVGLPLDQYAKTPTNFVQSTSGLIRLIRREQIEVVISSHRWGSFVAYIATRATKSRLISVDQNVLWGNRFLTVWGDGLVSVSENSRRHLIEYFKVPAEKIRLVHNAITPLKRASTQVQAALRDEFNLADGRQRPILLAVGRLAEQKGLCYLLDAMPKIVDALPDVCLLIVGEGDLGAQLKDQAKTLGIAEHIRFAGLRSDVAAFCSIADLFVMPSLWEGLPVALLEAMSLGLPVVATDVGGIPEVMALSNPSPGKMVPSQNSDALSGAVIELWRDDARREAAAVASKQIVYESFSMESMVDQMEDYLRQFAQDSLR